jgi:hypothetical protein
MDWNLVTAICTAVLAFTGVYALWFASQQLKQNREEAQVQHLLMLSAQYEQEPMVTYRKVCAQKRLAGDSEPPEEDRIISFFETVALLVNRGYLKETDVWETFSADIFPLYADARNMIADAQKDDPPTYLNFMSLVKKLKSIEAQQGGTSSTPSEDDVKGFWQDELDVTAGTPIRHRKRRTTSR